MIIAGARQFLKKISNSGKACPGPICFGKCCDGYGSSGRCCDVDDPSSILVQCCDAGWTCGKPGDDRCYP